MSQANLPRRVVRKLIQLLLPAYYRLLWGRRFPGAGRLESWVSREETAAGRGDAPQDQGAWDRQYAEGRWSLMGDPIEAPRYGALAAMLRVGSLVRSVLDVGCGDGLLRRALGPGEAPRYVGVDLSREAIERARPHCTPGDELVVADAEHWEPAAAFDAVVLNECLYYFRRPIESLERYLAARSAGGILLVSMFATPRSRAIRRRITRRHAPVQELELRTARGVWWIAAFGNVPGERARVEGSGDD